MKRGILFIAALVFAGLAAQSAAAQQAWTLQQCIEYAIENNISVQQMELSSQNSEIRLNTARNSRLPSLNANIGGSASFGRSLGRENTYVDRTQISGNLGVSTSVPVFNGFNIKHNIAGRELDFKASLHDLERAREDVAVTVTSLYMQVLFNKELLKVAENQVELSRQQLTRSELLFKNDRSPESDVYEAKALVARDELSLTQSRNNLSLSILDLAQALNLDEYKAFDVMMPRLEEIDMFAMSSLENPRELYEYAVANRPRILAEQMRLESSEKSLKMAQSARWPSINLGASYGNNAYQSFTSGAVNKAFIEQMKTNGSESVSLSMNIPIFNKLSTRNNIMTAQVNIKMQELTLLNAQLALNKEIEQAYHSATAAYDKYLSAEKSVEAARIAFKYAEEKSVAERSTIFDFNDAKTRLERSESEAVQAKFDFVFRSKILDFYADKPLEFELYY